MATSRIAPDAPIVGFIPASHSRPSAPWWLACLAPVLLVAPVLAYASYRAFPLYDDGWLSLLIREQGTGVVGSTMPERPVYAALMAALFRPGQNEVLAFVAVTVALWIAFALVAGKLWRRLSPAHGQYAPLVSILVVAPIIATCQLTTIVTCFQLLPPILVFTGIILLYGYIEDGRQWRLLVTALLVVGGSLVSEYSVPSAAAGLVLLLRPVLLRENAALRRRASVAVIVLGVSCLIGYAVYSRIGDTSYRPSVNPSVATSAVKRNPLGVVLNVANGTWHSVAGAYGSALGRVSIHWDSKSTLVAIAYAIPVGWALVAFCRKREDEEEIESPGVIDCLVPVVAVAAGLLPVALMGRNTFMLGFGSRFLIPILPVAAAASVSIVLLLTRPAIRWAVVACAGLICANAVIMTANTSIQEHNLAIDIGRMIQPLLSTTGGNTAAVVNRQGIDYEFTATAALNWSADQSRKFWLYDEAAGRKALGSRKSCIQPSVLAVNQRQVQRSGPIDVLLWVETLDLKVVSIEPYCRAADKTNPKASN